MALLAVLVAVLVAVLWAKPVILHPTLIGFCTQIIEPATNPLSVCGSKWANFNGLSFGVCNELSAGSAWTM